MDNAALPGEILTWIFTLGNPNAEVMSQLVGLIESGYCSWVVVPIHADVETIRGSGWQSASAVI